MATTKDKIFYLLDNSPHSQDEFANYLKVSKQVVSNWRYGRNNGYMKHVNDIAEFFDVTLDELRPDDNNIEKNVPVKENVLLKHLKKTYSDDDLMELASLNRNQAVAIVEQAKKLKEE